jgi:hypothetical protein
VNTAASGIESRIIGLLLRSKMGAAAALATGAVMH